jgi:hypothetical protein
MDNQDQNTSEKIISTNVGNVVFKDPAGNTADAGQGAMVNLPILKKLPGWSFPLFIILGCLIIYYFMGSNADISIGGLNYLIVLLAALCFMLGFFGLIRQIFVSKRKKLIISIIFILFGLVVILPIILLALGII